MGSENGCPNHDMDRRCSGPQYLIRHSKARNALMGGWAGLAPCTHARELHNHEGSR
jgi:hypothetical protein